MADIFDEVANEQAPDPSMWKDKTKVLVTRNRLNGRVERWKLEDGKPVLIKEERK
jgi:hypothetical protein